MGMHLVQDRRDVPSARLSFRLRVVIVLLPGLAALGVILATPRLPQASGYHQFADDRTLLGIPHVGDVITNVAFVIVGAGGLGCIAQGLRARQRRMFPDRREAWAYAMFFAGLVLTGVGSAWYHWAPSDDSLLWYRLPMALAFMGLFAAVITDRISRKAGLRLLPLLLAAGVLSVLHWHHSERLGQGDTRFYALVQFYPLLAVPLILLLFGSRYTHAGYLWGTVGWYVAAKVVEVLDRPIFALTGVVSGHNLKHLFAALAGLWVLLMLRRRQPE